MRGLRTNGLLLGALLLGACATTPKAPGIKVEYVEKPVIVETRCVKAKDVPSRPGSLASAGVPENIERALSVALAKVSEWTRYGNKADALLKGCAS